MAAPTGSRSPFSLSLPIVVEVLFSGALEVAIATSMTTFVVGLALVVQSGAGAAELAKWAAALAGGAAIAIYAAILGRRALAAELALNRARLRALNDAAESDAARARAEQLALLGMLAAGLGHEVNNPLVVLTVNLKALAEALRGGHVSDRELRELVAEAELSTKRITAVMRELSAFVPVDRDAEHCELVALVRGVIAEEKPRGLLVHDALADGPLHVMAFAPQLRRIIKQLLVSVAERSAATVRPEVWTSVTSDADSVLLSVEDNGPTLWSGTADSDTSTFSVNRGTSSGLGLALVRESLRQWGGDLVVTGRAGGGARIVLRFRAAPATVGKDG
ncbi:MAG: hypothetical protein IT381_23255 [Deltaproteobacteria bacterium]|nr:hypothetical protein [Deltaproteobacteria bacterium]